MLCADRAPPPLAQHCHTHRGAPAAATPAPTPWWCSPQQHSTTATRAHWGKSCASCSLWLPTSLLKYNRSRARGCTTTRRGALAPLCLGPAAAATCVSAACCCCCRDDARSDGAAAAAASPNARDAVSSARCSGDTTSSSGAGRRPATAAAAAAACARPRRVRRVSKLSAQHRHINGGVKMGRQGKAVRHICTWGRGHPCAQRASVRAGARCAEVAGKCRRARSRPATRTARGRGSQACRRGAGTCPGGHSSPSPHAAAGGRPV